MRIQSLVAVVLCMALSSPGGANLITPEQAMEAVRAFEGDATLQFENVALTRNTSLPLWQLRDKYELYQQNLRDHRWKVEAVTGEVVDAVYFDAWPKQTDYDTPFGPLTEVQCKQIAESFARLHYDDFDTRNLQLMEPNNGGRWTGDGWDFTWREKIACGAWTPTVVSVGVSPVDGKIYSYHTSRFATPTPPSPQLNAQQAIAAAAQVVGIVDLKYNDEPFFYATPEGITWTVEVGGGNAQSNGVHRIVKLDAVTGQVVEIKPVIASAAPNAQAASNREVNKPASKKSNVEMAPIRDVVSSLSGATMKWDASTGARLTFGGKTYTIKQDSATVIWDKGSITLSQKTVLKNGRLFVPKDFVDQLSKATRKDK